MIERKACFFFYLCWLFFEGYFFGAFNFFFYILFSQNVEIDVLFCKEFSMFIVWLGARFRLCPWKFVNNDL